LTQQQNRAVAKIANQEPVGLAAEKLARGSRQKPRLLPAADAALSEKSASATFFQ
jgi:hypothetical protein